MVRTSTLAIAKTSFLSDIVNMGFEEGNWCAARIKVMVQVEACLGPEHDNNSTIGNDGIQVGPILV